MSRLEKWKAQRWREKVKQRDNYTCQECGSTELIQAHDPTGEHTDIERGISLCASCHANKHPDVPRGLFFSKSHHPRWQNMSAAAVARKVGCHRRTVIRTAKRLGLLTSDSLSVDELKALVNSISPRRGRVSEVSLQAHAPEKRDSIEGLDIQGETKVKTRKVMKVGTSKVVCLPKSFLDYHKIGEGDRVTLFYDSRILILPERLESEVLERKGSLLEKLLR